MSGCMAEVGAKEYRDGPPNATGRVGEPTQKVLEGDRFMGLRQTISEWVRITKDALDFGPEFPAAMAARHCAFAEELTKLQHLLEQARKASQKKDELIARLQAGGVVTGDMVVDGSAYFVRKENVLDGPFCLSCFQQNHEATRIVPAPMPKGVEGSPAEWVQCVKCRTPFRSDRMGEFLHPHKDASAPPEGEGEAKPVKATSKLRSQTRQPKSQRPEPTRMTLRRRATR